MTTNADLVIVSRSCFDLLWQHCSNCHHLGDQQRAFLQEHHVKIPYTPPPQEPASTRRKNLLNPSTTSSSELLKSKKGGRKKKKHRVRDWFLQNAPKAGQWHNRQVNVVGGAKNYEAVVQSLIERSKVSSLEETHQNCPESENDLVMIGTKLAVLADSSLRNGALQKHFSYFQALLFLSYCGLLEKRGFSYETIDQITQHVSCFREMDRRRLRSQALKINILICKLAESGWTIYRATELFLISSTPVSLSSLEETYSHLGPLSPTYLLNFDEKGFQCILEVLTRSEYVQHDFSDCLMPEYTIPGLISHMVHVSNAVNALSYQTRSAVESTING